MDDGVVQVSRAAATAANTTADEPRLQSRRELPGSRRSIASFLSALCAKNPHLRQRCVTAACPDANHRATEDAMPALRIATAGAALLVLTAGSTIAQPTGTATSKPISILKILAPSDNSKIKPHGHRLGMATWRTHAVAAHPGICQGKSQ